jgi:hypothetical protein
MVEHSVEGVAGPPILDEGAKRVLCNPELGGVADRLQTFKQDMFAYRTKFKADGFDQERHAQGHVHWGQSQDADKEPNQFHPGEGAA